MIQVQDIDYRYPESKLLLDASVGDICDLYSFTYRTPAEMDDTVLYAEPTLQGNAVIAKRKEGEPDAIFYSFFIFAHSFCTLGGTFYRKMAPLFTFATGLVLFLALGYLENWMAHTGFLNFLTPYTEGHNYIFTTVLCIFFLAISAFNYWASYKIFSHMQVISNKWINI